MDACKNSQVDLEGSESSLFVFLIKAKGSCCLAQRKFQRGAEALRGRHGQCAFLHSSLKQA